jgi:hypothetical protein
VQAKQGGGPFADTQVGVNEHVDHHGPRSAPWTMTVAPYLVT